MEDYGHSNATLTKFTFSGNWTLAAPSGSVTWHMNQGGAIALRGGAGAVLNNVTFNGKLTTTIGGAICNSAARRW